MVLLLLLRVVLGLLLLLLLLLLMQLLQDLLHCSWQLLLLWLLHVGRQMHHWQLCS
jgi:hypothetical protein